MPTTVTLYRNGNASTPRLDNVRDQDVTYVDPGHTTVQGGVKGISSFDASAVHAGVVISGKNWWTLPPNTPIVAGLTLINDNNPPGHWGWQPGHDMLKSEFTNLLGLQGATTASGGRWSGPSASSWPGPAGATAEREVAMLTAQAAQVAARQVPLTAKPHAFVLDALDGQIAAMRDQLARVGDDEDAASDLTNDLVLLQLIHAHLAAQGPILL